MKDAKPRTFTSDLPMLVSSVVSLGVNFSYQLTKKGVWRIEVLGEKQNSS